MSEDLATEINDSIHVKKTHPSREGAASQQDLALILVSNTRSAAAREIIYLDSSDSPPSSGSNPAAPSESRDELMTADAGVPARRTEPCYFCRAAIAAGDVIYPIGYGRYGCSSCADDAGLYARLHIKAPKRDAPGYARPCSACGAAPGDVCVTSSGKKRPLHPKR